jgi:redox-sensitive bicupin YhaK (pirin superfamily)
VYVFEGALQLGDGADATVVAHQLAVMGPGQRLTLRGPAAGGEVAGRAIVVAGRPLREPVARHGPFVMNTQAELLQAFQDYQGGRF